MKQVAKIVVTALILTLTQGCVQKKAKVKPAPQAQAPATEQSGALYPPPFPEKTETPPVVPEPTTPDVVPAPKPVPQKKPPTHKKPNPSNSSTTKAKPSAAKPVATAPATSDASTGAPAVQPPAPEAAGTQQAASVEPSAVSPIGQLSSGEGGAGSQKRHETSDMINNTEQGLNNIKRNLSATEQETAAQIRAYLKQAKKALTVDDLDGASTLATKAKVLLEELTKP
jgi:outer membrane biosynthesis protein TonB